MKAASKRRCVFETRSCGEVILEENICKLDARISDNANADFFKHFNGVELERQGRCSFQYSKDKQGRLTLVGIYGG